MTNSGNGAIIQRDGQTFALTTKIPAGIITPDQLETIARVGRKYRVPILTGRVMDKVLFSINLPHPRVSCP